MQHAVSRVLNALAVFLCGFFLAGCPSLGSSGSGTPAGAVADLIEVYQQDINDLAPAASPEFQAKLIRINIEVDKVEAALRALDAGVGDITAVEGIAKAALIVVEQVLVELEAGGRDVRDIRFAVGVIKIAFRHLQLGDVEQAEATLEEPMASASK
jgi:hypothetical protein